MPRYAAFLGRINVGKNQLKMDTLRAILGDAGFANVATVVASGNVLFDHDDAADAALEQRIAGIIAKAFAISTFAAVRSRDEVAAAIADNPFAGEREDKLVHTHFLTCQPSAAAFRKLTDDHAGRGIERLALGDRAIYIDFVDGVGNSKLTAPFMAKRLGCEGTARNVRSLRRILDKMD